MSGRNVLPLLLPLNWRFSSLAVLWRFSPSGILGRSAEKLALLAWRSAKGWGFSREASFSHGEAPALAILGRSATAGKST
jgi:hypothetical protein